MSRCDSLKHPRQRCRACTCYLSIAEHRRLLSEASQEFCAGASRSCDILAFLICLDLPSRFAANASLPVFVPTAWGQLGFQCSICDDICLSVTLPPFAASSHKRQRPSAWRAPQKNLCSLAGAHTSIMVANSIPQGQVKAGDKIVNDVKLTNIPAGRFDGQLRPYSQADVEKLR